MKFSVKDFFSICDQIRSKHDNKQIWPDPSEKTFAT